MVNDTPRDVLSEREREIDRLRAGAAGAAGALRGAGRLLLVEGPAGIGKTRLLDRAAQEAGMLGATVLRARGGALEREFSYGVARQLLERPLAALPVDLRETVLAGAAVHAAPALGLAVVPREGDSQSPPPADRVFSVLHGLYWLVANLAETRPLALVVDDLQWADATSLRFLVHLVRRLEDLPVLVCAAVRAGEGAADDAALAALAGDHLTEVLRPAPVSEEAVGAWLAAAYGSEPGPALGRSCHRVTGGNPFLVGELVAALRAAGAQLDGENTLALVDELGPRTLSRAILLRLGDQSAAAAALARAVALLGTEVELAHGAALAALGLEAAASAADRLAVADILRPGRPLEFVHPIVRTAIHADLPAAELARGHARAAALLATLGADPERVAVHLLATDPAGASDTVVALRAAARVALERGAPDNAARFLRRALAEPPRPGERAAVEGALGAAELRAGRTEPAVAHLRAAIAGEPAGPARAPWGLALALARVALGDVGGAVDVLELTIEETAHDPELARCVEAELAIAFIDPQVFARGAERLERHAYLRGETPGERLLLAACARSLALREQPVTRAVAIARRALDRGLLQDAAADGSHVANGAIWALVLGDDLDEAQRLLGARISQERERGSLPGFAGASLIRALARLADGSVLGAEADARAAIAVFDVSHRAGAPVARAGLVEALVEQGRFEEAEEALATLHDEIFRSHTAPVNRLRHSRARLRLATGRHELALADALETGRLEEPEGFISPLVPWRQVAALALRGLDRVEEARVLAGRQVAIARAYGTASLIGASLRVAALVGERSVRTERLEEAVAALEGSPARLEHARALVDLATARSRDGHRTVARSGLEEAHERAQDLGAFALADRAHEELLTLGARPRRRAFSGVEALTAGERRVAAMAAQGRGNREIAQALFVTAKTVENHLGRAYHKLGIHSRDELAPRLAGEQEHGDVVTAPRA